MAATALRRTTVRLSSGISANILDFGIPQKHVLTEMPAMETSGKAGGGEVPTCQTAPWRQARDRRVDLDPPAIGALALEHGAGVMQAMGQHMDIGIGPRHQSAIVPDDAIDFVERNSHGLSPGSTHESRVWRHGAV